MGWDRDRALNVAGAALAVVVLLSIALAVFGAVQATTQDEEPPPDAEWSVERVNDSHVTIEHVGNETVFSEHVAITVNGRLHKKSFHGAVRPGDEATIEALPGRTIRVVWTEGSGDDEIMQEAQV